MKTLNFSESLHSASAVSFLKHCLGMCRGVRLFTTLRQHGELGALFFSGLQANGLQCTQVLPALPTQRVSRWWFSLASGRL